MWGWAVVRRKTTANSLVEGVRGGFGFVAGRRRWEEGETTENDLIRGGLRWVLLGECWWEVVGQRTTAKSHA